MFFQQMQIRRTDRKFAYKTKGDTMVPYGSTTDCKCNFPSYRGTFMMDFTGTGFYFTDVWTTVGFFFCFVDTGFNLILTTIISMIMLSNLI